MALSWYSMDSFIVAFRPWPVKPWLVWLFLGKLMAFTDVHDPHDPRRTQKQSRSELEVHPAGEGVSTRASGIGCRGGQDCGQQD